MPVNAEFIETGSGNDTVDITSSGDDTAPNYVSLGDGNDRLDLVATEDATSDYWQGSTTAGAMALKASNAVNHEISVFVPSGRGIFAGAGNDVVNIAAGRDVYNVSAGEGDDALTVSAGRDISGLWGGDGGDVLSLAGGMNIDTLPAMPATTSSPLRRAMKRAVFQAARARTSSLSPGKASVTFPVAKAPTSLLSRAGRPSSASVETMVMMPSRSPPPRSIRSRAAAARTPSRSTQAPPPRFRAGWATTGSISPARTKPSCSSIAVTATTSSALPERPRSSSPSAQSTTLTSAMATARSPSPLPTLATP